MTSNGRFVITEKALHAQLCRTLKTESLSGAEVTQATAELPGNALTLQHCGPSHLRRDPACLPRYIAESCARTTTGTKHKGCRLIRTCTCRRDCEYRAVADIRKNVLDTKYEIRSVSFQPQNHPVVIVRCQAQQSLDVGFRRGA